MQQTVPAQYADDPYRNACSLTVMVVAQILLTSAPCTLLQNTEALCHPPLWSTRGRCTWRRTRAPCCCASLRAVQHRSTGKTGCVCEWCPVDRYCSATSRNGIGAIVNF